MKIAIVKYNAGNIQSVIFSLQRLGVDPILTDDPEVLLKSDKLIFPGQGEAKSAMAYIRKHHIDEVIKAYDKPFLGICVGLQLMCRHSEEGDTDCLNIFDLPVKKFVTSTPEMKIPHMGWNTIHHCDHPVLSNTEGAHLYYVHSYYAALGAGTVGQTTYDQPFAAAIAKDNYIALQAHLEKSGQAGQQIMQNFINL